MIPKTLPWRHSPPVTPNSLLLKTFSRLVPIALGISIGLAGGAALFSATLFLVIKGGEVVGPNLGLPAQFFAGYSVTAPGACGFAWAFGAGFVSVGRLHSLRNLIITAYLHLVRLWTNLSQERFLDRFD